MYCHTGQCLVYDPSNLQFMFQLFRPELFEGTLTVDDEVNAGFVVVARDSPESRHLLRGWGLRWRRQLLLRVKHCVVFCLRCDAFLGIVSFGFCGMGEGFCTPSSRGTNNRGGSRARPAGRTRSPRTRQKIH